MTDPVTGEAKAHTISTCGHCGEHEVFSSVARWHSPRWRWKSECQESWLLARNSQLGFYMIRNSN